MHHHRMDPNDLSGRLAKVVGPKEIEDFRRDGAVCLRGLLNAGDIERCRDGIAENIAHPS